MDIIVNILRFFKNIYHYYLLAFLWIVNLYNHHLSTIREVLALLVLTAVLTIVFEIASYIPTEPPLMRTKPKKVKMTGDRKADQIIEEGQKIVSSIHNLTIEIDDAKISTDVYQIEIITYKILNYLSSHMDKSSEVSSLINYYLPTTNTLLEKYKNISLVGIEGKNISATKNKIISILDVLVTTFKRKLDNLYENELVDMSIEASVLESMLTREGIIVDEIQKVSAAKGGN